MSVWKTILEDITDLCGGTVLHGYPASAEILSDKLSKAYFDGSCLRTARFKITLCDIDQNTLLSALDSFRNSVRSLPYAVRTEFDDIIGSFAGTGEYSYSMKLSVTYFEPVNMKGDVIL